MKKRYKILVLVIIIIILFTLDVSAEVITKDEAILDLDYLVNRFEEVHPNIYFHISKDESEEKIKKITERLKEKDRWSSREIYRIFSPFVASFKDAHTYISINKQFNDAYDKGAEIFPLDIKLIDDKVLIENNYSEAEIEKNTEILTINGIRINEIIDKMIESISSENEIYAYAVLEKTFPIYLWALFDFDHEYDLLLKNNIGKEFVISLKGVLKDVRIDHKKKDETKNWTLDFPIKGNAYLTINTFNGSLKSVFKKDIKKYFKEINKKEINNLFIDISENGGGNTDLAKYLFEYIYDGSYRLFKEVRMKYSDYVFHDRFNIFTNLYYQFKKDRDDLIVFTSTKEETKENDLRFDGDIYLITSNFTFSTAVDFAAIVKDHNAGIILGEETGGLASCYGDIISDKLPNSKLSLGISYKYFLRPAGFDNGRGVMPDINLDISKLKYQYGEENYKKMVIRSISL